MNEAACSVFGICSYIWGLYKKPFLEDKEKIGAIGKGETTQRLNSILLKDKAKIFPESTAFISAFVIFPASYMRTYPTSISGIKKSTGI